MILPHVFRGSRSESNSSRNRTRAPRVTNTEAVHLTNLHVAHHLRWGNNDQRNILIRVDSARAEIITHPHRVRAWRKCHRKGQRLAEAWRFGNERLDGGGIGANFAFPLRLKRNRLTVAIHQPWNDYWLLRRASQPHCRSERHSDEHVSGLNRSARKIVSNRRPVRAFGYGRVNAVFLEQTFFVRNDSN